jgi:hypothetical protein
MRSKAIRGTLQVRLLSVVAEDAIDRGAAYTEGCRDGRGRFAAVMHPSSQSALVIAQRLRATNGLSACTPCIPRCGASFLAQCQLS